MRTYHITITGKTPLLMHRDDIEWADRMEAWKLNPKNKAQSKAGDDRTPPYRWLGSLYHDTVRVTMPTDNLMRALMSGGALMPTGKGQKTFKAQTQSGIMAPDLAWPLLVKDREIPTASLFEGMETRTYDGFQELVAGLGFSLFLKRAGITGKAKHIRVRPRFDQWSASGALIVLDEAITRDVLQQIGTMAGQYAGLMDWRPGSRTPGPWGMFEFRVTG